MHQHYLSSIFWLLKIASSWELLFWLPIYRKQGKHMHFRLTEVRSSECCSLAKLMKTYQEKPRNHEATSHSQLKKSK